MQAVVDVATEVAGAMKPRAGADEDVAAKPFRTIVAGWGAVVGSNVIISVRAFRSDADIDADLGFCFREAKVEANCGNRRHCQKIEFTHLFTFGSVSHYSGCH